MGQLQTVSAVAQTESSPTRSPAGTVHRTSDTGGSGQAQRRARTAWGFATQALSSASNFTVGIIVVRSVPLSEIGAWSLAYAAYLFSLGLFRSFAGKTYAIRFATAPTDRQQDGQAAVTGLALLWGLVTGSLLVIVAATTGPLLRPALLITGMLLPLLLLHDAWRITLVAIGRSARSAALDSIWILLAVPAFAAALTVATPSAATLIAAWGVSGSLAALAGLALGTSAPSARAALRFLRSHRDLAWPLAGEQVTSQGATQAGVLILGALLPLSAMGTLRTGQVLYSPLNLLQLAAPLVGLPEVRRVQSSSVEQATALVNQLALLLAGSAAVAMVGLWLIPESIGTAIIGESFAAGRTLLLPLGLRNVGGGITLAAFVGLHALEQPRISMVIGATRGVLMLAAVVPAALTAGLTGAVWVMAGADLLAAGLAIVALRRAAVRQD